MKLNWPIIGMISIGIWFWTNVWFNGFLNSILWLVVLSAVIAIGFKLYEERY